MLRNFRRLAGLALLCLALPHPAFAASVSTDTPVPSALDRDLFYELLVGELSAQSGDINSAYALILDAARKTRNAQLYQRAVELALGARAGESALAAARAWNIAFPASPEANRYLVQILIGLNRVEEIQEPLKRHLALLGVADRNAVLTLLPRYFSRATDKAQVASVVEQALANELKDPATGAAAWSTLGLLRAQAGDTQGAMDASRKASSLSAQAEEPIYLALHLMEPKNPQAEALVLKHLAHKSSAELRMTYVRRLLDAQRWADAYAQAQILTREWPAFADGWLVCGSLALQNHQSAPAQEALATFLKLSGANDQPSAETETTTGQVQAYLLLAQIAEQAGQYAQARDYLQRINSPKDALRVASRQAALLAREGQLEQGIQLIHDLAVPDADSGLSKINAEVQLLRDNKQFQRAFELLSSAIARYPDETDLLYDQAMLAEKLGKADEMEKLLRRLIKAKPDYYHAYNALGFSLADRNVRIAEARALVQKALEFAPNDPFIVDSLAWVEYRAGNAAQALKLLQDAFSARPDAEIAAHLGEVLWTTGQREPALAIWKQAAELSPDNETLLETTERLQSKP